MTDQPMRLVFSNDDVGCNDFPEHVQWFREVVEYITARGIRATFFWVPMSGDRPSYELKDWMEAIRWARDLGHDFQLHGLGHHCLDFGVPQPGILRENPKAFEEFEKNRDHWVKEHSYQRLREKLERGIEIYEKAFGCRPVIFRSPCGGICANLYLALYDVGLRYDSSRIVNPGTWVYTVFHETQEREWKPEFPPYPHLVKPGVTVYPMMVDYSHHGLPDEHFDDLLSLAKQDYGHLMREGREVGVLLCHYHSMHQDWQQTKRFYDAFLDHLQEQGWAFTNFRQVIAGE